MKTKWEIFDNLYDNKGNVVVVRWICVECSKVCLVELPPRKNIYHCLKEKENEIKSNSKKS